MNVCDPRPVSVNFLIRKPSAGILLVIASVFLFIFSQTGTSIGHVPVHCAEGGRTHFLQGKCYKRDEQGWRVVERRNERPDRHVSVELRPAAQ